MPALLPGGCAWVEPPAPAGATAAAADIVSLPPRRLGIFGVASVAFRGHVTHSPSPGGRDWLPASPR